MSPTEVFVDGLVPLYDAQGDAYTVVDANGNTVPRLGLFQGSGIEIAPGLYLTSDHIFVGPFQRSDGVYYTGRGGAFYVDPTTVINSGPTQRSVSGDNPVTLIKNLSGYVANPTSSQVHHDIAAFNAATPDNNATGVVLFLNPNQSQMQSFFPSVNFEGFPKQDADSATGVVQSNIASYDNESIQNVQTANGMFGLTGVAPVGVSGAGVWGALNSGQNASSVGQNYVLGTIVGTDGTSSLANYLLPTEYYSLFPLSNGDKSEGTHNLIVGSSNGGDLVRGAFQTTDVVESGNENIILAGGNGDTINAGSGTGNVIFSSQEAGVADSGTTFVLGAGTSTIYGGNPNDKLVLLADRLWSKTSGDPSVGSMSDNSATIQITGGTGNIPGATFAGFTAPDPGFFSVNTDSAVAGNSSDNPADGNIGSFAFDVDFYQAVESNGSIDLTIETIAPDLSSNGAQDLWVGTTVINDFHEGDFGLTFAPSADYQDFLAGQISLSQYQQDEQDNNSAFINAAAGSPYADDDSSVDWTGIYNTSPPSLSAQQASDDLENLELSTGFGAAGGIIGGRVNVAPSTGVISPFAGLSVSDPSGQAGASSLTVQLGGVGGVLEDGTGFDGLVGSATAGYTLTGSSSDLTGELEALTFTPSSGYSSASPLSFTLTDQTPDGVSRVYASMFGLGGTLQGANETIDVEAGASGTVSGEADTVFLQTGAQALISGAGDSVNFSSSSNEVVTLSNTGGTWDTVYGGNGQVDLSDAQTSLDGGGYIINLTANTQDQLTLSNTLSVADTVNGSDGTLYLESAEVLVDGSGNSVEFYSGANSVTLSGTADAWDSITGVGGEVNLDNAETGIDGGGYIVNTVLGSQNQFTLSNTAGVLDTVNGSNGTMYLEDAQASVYGGGESVEFYSGSDNAVNLFDTNGLWDSVTGVGGQVDLNNADSGIDGGGYTIDLAAGTQNQFTLSNTNGVSDVVNGSGDAMYLEDAQASVHGGDDSIQFYSGTNSVGLFDTNGTWDSVTGVAGQVDLDNAQTGVDGGGFTVNLLSGSQNQLTLSNTGSLIDNVAGSGGSIYLENANAQILGDDNAASILSGYSQILMSGTGNSVTASADNSLISITGTASVILSGRNEELNLNANSTVNVSDAGMASLINVNSGPQFDTFTGFASSDTGAIIDLKNGVGGYTSSDQVAAALQDDGAGGTMLSLGGQSQIDFAGTSASQLDSSHFKIG